MGITSYYQGLSGTPKPTGQTPVSTGGGITSYYNNLKPTTNPTSAPIKIAPTAKKIDLSLLQKAQQTISDISTKVGGAVGKLASFLPEKSAPIQITPTQKKLDKVQLKQLEGYKPPQQDSATLTTQAKQQTVNKFKQIRESFRTKSVEEVKRPIKPGYKEPGVLGSMVEALQEGSVSLVSNLGASTEMVGNITNMLLLTAAGKKIQKEADKVLASNPEWAADPLEKWGTKKVARLVTGAVPSLLGVIAATMVAGPAGATLAGFGMEAGPTYKEAKEAGATERQAQVYGTTVGTINGVLERIFPAELLKGAGKQTVKQIGKSLWKDVAEQAVKYGVKFTAAGTLEGSTEALQEMWSNVIATNYDKNRKVWDNTLESFVGGFGSGGVAGVTEQSIRKNLPPGENDPQTVINEVIKQKAENTEEGKALIKEAVIAQKTGEKVVIEKPVEQPSTPQGGVETKIQSKEVSVPTEEDTTLLTSEQAKEVETKDTEYTKQVREKISKLEEDITQVRQENEVKKSILDQFEGKTIQGMRTLKRSMMSIEEKGGDYQIDIKKLPSYNKTIYDVMAAIGTDSESEAIRYIREDLPDTIVKADTKQALQEIKVLKSHIKPTEASAPRQQLPVGEGKEKVSRLEARMKGVMDSATEEQIQNLGLTTYQQMNKKETIAKAAEYVSTNRDDAIKVLKGDLEAPKGIPPEALYIALTQASKEDATLITKLASLQATAIGQRLSLLTELDTDSPVKLLNEVYKIREEQAKKKYKNIKKVVDTGVENARKEIKQVNKYDIAEFFKNIEC